MDRFDRIAIGVIGGLVLGIGVAVARGDQLGMRLQTYSPTGSVSSRTTLQMTFDGPIDQTSLAAHFAVDPSVQGTFTTNGDQATFRPSTALQPGKTYQVTVRAGAVSTEGRALKQDVGWQFQIRQPSIMSLGPQDSPPWNLYQTDPASPDNPQQITSGSLGINSFDILPDGSKVVYAEQFDGTQSALYVWDTTSKQSTLLYTCDNARCLHPVWRPDGIAVAFEHVANTGTVLTVPRVWLYDVATSTARQLLNDNQITGQQPRWSPDGTRLAFSEVDAPNVYLHDFTSGKDSAIPSGKGEVPIFSPGGKWLTLQKTVAPAKGERATHLTLMDLSTDTHTRHDIVLDNDPLNIEAFAWIDAKTLIIARRAPYSEQADTGSQLYSLDITTGKSTLLLNEQGFSHTDFVLNPTGDALLLERQPVGKPGPSGNTYLYTLADGKLGPLLKNQSDPDWLP